MINQVPEGAYFAEGHSQTRPPYFSGAHFSHWKNRMRFYIQSIDYAVWDVITEGNRYPTKKDNKGETVLKPRNEWTVEDKQMMQTNARAVNLLFCSVSGPEYDKISSCETAKEIWDKLEVTHEGTSKVKETRINTLVYEYELFSMRENENIEDMFNRFSKIIGDLKALGRRYTDREQIMKILRSLPRAWQSKVDTIESTGITDMSFDELRGILIAYERTHLKRHELEQKRKTLALKAAALSDQFEDENDEDFALYSKKFERYARRKDQPWKQKVQSNQKEIKKDDQGKNSIICFECGKQGHTRSNCPFVKRKPSKFYKKKAMAAWSDEDEEDEEELEQEMANLCFVATEEIEVESEPSLQEFYDDLLTDFQKLLSKYERLSNVKTKLEENCHNLENKLGKITEENEKLISKIEILNDYQLLKNENESLKSQVSSLTKDLANFVKGEENLRLMLGQQKCMFDKTGIGYEKHNNVKLYKNFFVKESNLYSSPTCFYCKKIGRTCYNCRSRKTHSNMVWVPKGTIVSKATKTNVKGPKQIWVPKKIENYCRCASRELFQKSMVSR